jgi:hypothetical protein
VKIILQTGVNIYIFFAYKNRYFSCNVLLDEYILQRPYTILFEKDENVDVCFEVLASRQRNSKASFAKTFQITWRTFYICSVDRFSRKSEAVSFEKFLCCWKRVESCRFLVVAIRITSGYYFETFYPWT